MRVPEPSGDFDEGGDVDGRDFLTWQRGYGITSGATRAQGDANYNGAVTSVDLGIWQNAYGSSEPAPLAAVLEPHALALATLLAAVVMNLRRMC